MRYLMLLWADADAARFESLRARRVPKRRPRPIADVHLTVLLSTPMHRRTRAMILLGICRLRVSEIAMIRGEDVDLITMSISVTGKGDKRRTSR